VLQEHTEVDLFLMDDGFQHRQAKRDFDLVLIDATNPGAPGYGHVLPRGLLREPLSGLSRANAFLITRAGDGNDPVIEQTLREIELAEAIGMDAVWLTEHHFDGAVAYADPVVFAAAVAMRTYRVRIGFAVVEMALHHPVRLAVQTALVDNLSRGRLIVGTGRGSAYNAYEYFGFGTTLAEGHERLPEAEALLIKAWTTDDVRHDGRYWQATFPRLRPRPYQKPHPPLVRACIGEDSLVEMAKIGRPVLLGVQTLERSPPSAPLPETMLAEGLRSPRWSRP
jgi:alkanesulfonate monooxygenase SsuD/methylene tetrahydromethanopterin reductase-like flavin-dependent oxidoreductase (luciferase family)